MPQLALDLDDDDDIDFIHAIGPVITGVLATLSPPEAYVVKIDSWFGAAWTAFSRKELGALGVHSARPLCIPPFVPNRVRSQTFYRGSATAGYTPADAPLTLHITQTSADNKHRHFTKLCPNTAAFWWSGNTRRNGRGSLMAYLSSSYWYAEYHRTDSWLISQTKRTSVHELAEYATSTLAA